jgi:arabinan endo-1,5-alpha-L-arabinosidase
MEFAFISRRDALMGPCAVSLAAVLPAGFSRAQIVPQSLNAKLSGDVTEVHDPAIIKAGDTYYLYSTTGRGEAPGPQISVRTSKDLLNWQRIGTVFDAVPAWVADAVPGAQGLWSPDIHFRGGKYWLYYAASTIGSNVSAIGLATNATLDSAAPHYKWEDQGLVLRSRKGDAFNCVDPSVTVDPNGTPWLVFGSFGAGIMLVKLNPATGKPGGQRFVLAARPAPDGAPAQIEAPSIIARNGWYYLFASYDLCCGGAASNYYTAYGRSRRITGPYLDSHGRALLKGFGTTLVRVNPPTDPMKGPGGGMVLRDGDQDYFVYQVNDQGNKGAATLRIAPLMWDAEGWVTAVK